MALAAGSTIIYPRAERIGPRLAGTARPNMVLIVLDAVRADHLREFGYSRATMPRLSSWAKSALVVRRAVSAAGWTAPSHASMFSGKTVSEHGIHYGETSFRTRAYRDIEWLPELLAVEGYDCRAVTANPLAVPKEVRGFDAVIAPRHIDWSRTIGGFVDGEWGIFPSLSESLRWRIPYPDAREVVGIVKRSVPEGAGPVFLFVNFLDAHSPYNPPERIGGGRPFSRYLSYRELTKRWLELPMESRQYLTDLYDGELRWIDGS